MKRIRHQQNFMVGLLLVSFCLLTAILAPRLSPLEDPAAPEMFKRVGRNSDMTPHPPDANALLGTLPSQYDVFHTVVWGMRSAFQFGLVVVLLAGSFGVFYGAASAYFGRQGDQVMMRISDAFMAFPVIAAVVFISQILSILLQKSGAIPSGGNWYFWGQASPLQRFLLQLNPVMISAILFSWMAYARLVNANVIRLKDQEFVGRGSGFRCKRLLGFAAPFAAQRDCARGCPGGARYRRYGGIADYLHVHRPGWEQPVGHAAEYGA